MSTINTSGKVAYMYNTSDDTWYALASVANSNLAYTWTATQTYNNTVIINESLISKKGINNFANSTARATAMGTLSSLNNGALSFITENNRLEYYSNGQWNTYGAVKNIETKTSSHTLDILDAGKVIKVTASVSNTITVPLNTVMAFPVGSIVEIVQYGTGQTTIAGTSGVVINSVNSNKRILSRYGSVKLINIATNEWLLTGDLKA